MVHTACPRCQGRIDPRKNEDGDRECINCGFVLYVGQDPSEVFWKQLQAKLEIILPKEPPKDRRAGRTHRKKRYNLTA